MELEGLTAAELLALIEQAQTAYIEAQQQEAAGEAQQREKIGDAINTLTALLGPENAQPGNNSIRALLKLDKQVMVQYAGDAFVLAFTALEMLTKTTLDVATVVGKQQ